MPIKASKWHRGVCRMGLIETTECRGKALARFLVWLPWFVGSCPLQDSVSLSVPEGVGVGQPLWSFRCKYAISLWLLRFRQDLNSHLSSTRPNFFIFETNDDGTIRQDDLPARKFLGCYMWGFQQSWFSCRVITNNIIHFYKFFN